MVAQFVAKKQDIKGALDAYNNWDLLITFKGQPLRGDEILQDFEEKSMLLPTRVEDFPDTHLPDYLKDHQGHPWQCQRCGRAAKKRNNVTRHKCSGGKQHKFLFAAVQTYLKLGDQVLESEYRLPMHAPLVCRAPPTPPHQVS